MTVGSESASRRPRKRQVFIVDAELLERVKDAASALAGHPAYLTLGTLVDGALERELARLAKKHNGGKPFPKRPRPLRGGRR